jgi:hypothetical protein
LQKSGAKLQIRDQRARRTQALESADDAESGLRSQRASGKVRMMTDAPCRASAVALPMPSVAPVTG